MAGRETAETDKLQVVEFEEELEEHSSANDLVKQHYEAEAETLKLLLNLEKEFRTHHTLMAKELAQQEQICIRLWTLTQRYVLLQSTGPCCQFPDVYPSPTEDVLLNEIAEKLKTIKGSNCRLTGSLKLLRKSCTAFERAYKRLDLSVESPFVIGDAFHKPITFFYELVNDLFKYFHAWLLKLKYSAHLIEPSNFEMINQYKSLVQPSEDFDEYLNWGLTYCKCLRPKHVCQSQSQ